MTMRLSIVDIAVVAISVLGIVWWALRHGRSGSSKAYFLAGRSMPWWGVGLSLFAASISSTTLIGQTGDAYSTGLAVFNYNLVGVFVMVFFATFLLPVYIRTGIFTLPEYLERRFDARSRYYFSFVSILGNVFLDAAGALYAAALIVKLLLPEADIRIIVLFFAALAASYTISGGLSSAINAEILQASILLVGSILLAVWVAASGGFDYLRSLIAAGDPLVRLIRPLDDPATPWLALAVGMPVTGLYFWANNQTLVQRVLSARSLDEGRKGVMLNGAITLLTLLLFAIPGVMCRHLFPGLERPDMVYPAMILNLMPVGLLGLMVAVLFAALTSTLGAIMNATSTLFTMDFYRKLDPRASDRRLVRVGKIVSLVVVVIAALWAPQIGRFDSLLKYYQEILSYLAPPVVAAFLLGIFSRRVNGHGVFAGLLAGLGVALLLMLFRTQIFGNMHFLFIVPILFLFSMVLMVAVSLLTAPPAADRLRGNLFSIRAFRAERAARHRNGWWNDYLLWGVVLLVCGGALLVLFS